MGIGLRIPRDVLRVNMRLYDNFRKRAKTPAPVRHFHLHKLCRLKFKYPADYELFFIPPPPLEIGWEGDMGMSGVGKGKSRA
jgi:hypothetical protein